MVGGSVILLALVLAACGSSNVVSTPNPSAAVAVTSPSASPLPSASPSASPSPTPTPTASPTATPSPTPSPTPALALKHCTGTKGRASTSTFTNKDKYFAGYLDTGVSNTVTCVEASWIQPAITCAAGDSKSEVVIYSGIGGTNGKGTAPADGRFEKAATEAYCFEGVPNYLAFTDALTAKNGFKLASFDVAIHDQIWTQVRVSGHAFTMTIADLTSGEIMTNVATVKDAIREDAQWEVQGTEVGCPKKCAPGPLAKFETFTFTGTEAVIGGALQTVDRWAHQVTTMATGSVKRAVASKLGNGTFTETWLHK